jgi:hypothetical protein
MRKEEVLQALETAEDLHLQQMKKIVSAISGEHISNPTALGKMECECGQWFYANEALMKKILSPQLFQRLDDAHERWHTEYENIYDIFFRDNQKSGGILSRLIKRKVPLQAYDKAKYYYKELQLATDDLLLVSLSAKRRVQALPQTKFDSLKA